jgi:beta-glucosidase
MKARLICCGLILMSTLAPSIAAKVEQNAVYKNPNKSIEARVKDLLKRMTLEEKAAQLQTVWDKRIEFESPQGEFDPVKAKQILGQGIGQIARPSENRGKGVISHKTPAQTLAYTNQLQQWLLDNTRLGIPALFHEEALHGHAGRYATQFPQAIGLASTWDAQLVHDIYAITAKEVRAIGAQQVLAPILDVARDPRWGRIEETMGEDPYLVTELLLVFVVFKVKVKRRVKEKTKVTEK